jgi:hypothetical protein
VDGLAADVHGDLYAAIAGATIFGTAPVVKVDPRTGTITPCTDELARFDFPTSLAFGQGPRDHKSVYVVNGGLFPEDRPEAAPSVVRVGSARRALRSRRARCGASHLESSRKPPPRVVFSRRRPGIRLAPPSETRRAPLPSWRCG